MSTESKTVCIVLTENGVNFARELKKYKALEIWSTKALKGLDCVNSSFKLLVSDAWVEFDNLIFFCSLGIVIRSIAPHLLSKFSDPAVLSLDEEANFCISVLSGHVGGANLLCEEVAGILGARAVVTTATDSKGTASLDLLMMKHGIHPKYYRNEIVKVNSDLVSGKEVNIYTDEELIIDKPGFKLCPLGAFTENSSGIWWDIKPPKEKNENLIWVSPATLVLGFGCKKGKSESEITKAVEALLTESGLELKYFKKIATIDIKAVEPGLISFSKTKRLPIEVVERASILEIQESFGGSDFVEKTLGIRAVAEPCAVLASNGKLIVTRRAYDGITLAVGGNV